MSSIKSYISKLTKTYGNKIEYIESTYDNTTLSLVPNVLRDLYRTVSKIEFPFGYIYPIEVAIEESQKEPFKSGGWYCFGFDKYFSFWLCRHIPDENNLSFVAWDHDIGPIDGAVFETVIDFLQWEQKEYDENLNIGAVMLDELPNDKTDFLSKLRIAFSLTISIDELLEETEDLPFTVVYDIPYLDAEPKINSTGHPECFSFYYKNFT